MLFLVLLEQTLFCVGLLVIYLNEEYCDVFVPGRNPKTTHSKKCWVVSTQIWVKYGQTPNVGLKM